MKRVVIVAIFFSFIAFALYGTVSALPSREDPNKSISSQDTSTSWINSLPHNKELFHIALGDSLAKGYGSENNGYVGIATAHLNETYQLKFQLENFAKNGITSEKLLNIVQQDSMKEKISAATLITISVGGNDILKLNKEKGIVETSKQLGTIREHYIENLTEILSIVREENPNAVIVLSQLYNPLQFDGILVKIAESFINDWNSDIANLSKEFAPIVTIKTNKLLTFDTKDIWAYDEIHPNDVGYKLIAEEMLKGLSKLKINKKDE